MVLVAILPSPSVPLDPFQNRSILGSYLKNSACPGLYLILMKTLIFIFAVLSASVPALHAQLGETDPQYRALCREALAKPITLPTPDPAIKPNCDSTISYFGIGQSVDYTAARSCALAEYSQSPNASPFYGAGILSMIYANGQGVPADLGLATRFTCESQASAAEIETRLDILAQNRDTHTLAKFDLCETATSINSQGWCTTIDARLSDIDRKQKLASLQAALAPTAAAPFDELQKAEDDFVQQRAANELDLSGVTSNALTLEEQNDLRDQFLADLLTISTPGFHQDIAFPAADKKLDAAYKPFFVAAERSRLPRQPKTILNTTISYKGILDTQHTWLRLRDAWMTFAKAASSTPDIDKQAATLVTVERTQQLNELTATN
jgi:uncharacterized protein YecT (DUF1311 family)